MSREDESLVEELVTAAVWLDKHSSATAKARAALFRKAAKRIREMAA
jgi:hypothetical protein